MDRSKEDGLEPESGETLKSRLDFTGKRMLDLGCGYGWHRQSRRWSMESSAVGIDISRKMLEVAGKRLPCPQVEYRCTAMEDMEFRKERLRHCPQPLAFPLY